MDVLTALSCFVERRLLMGNLELRGSFIVLLPEDEEEDAGAAFTDRFSSSFRQSSSSSFSSSNCWATFYQSKSTNINE
jgi:hypothetical protein